jgi:hypothetical protein
MANRMLALALRNSPYTPAAMMGMVRHSSAQTEALSKIGNRDVVGYGWNGQPCYADRVDYPMPAIRFKENTPDILVSIFL